MLSYSFSAGCPASQRQYFLLQAREAFTIGLLTKAEGESVTSKQELHTFLKAAYSLAVAHKWLGAPQEVVAQATQACQKALTNFYDYDADTHDKDSLCAEIMRLVTQVKLLLQVEPFPNSDKGSFIPDSYRNTKDPPVNFTLEGFAQLMQRFQKYHASFCEATSTNCKGTKDEIDGARLCITALGTTIGTLNTECSAEACKVPKGAPKGEEPQQRGSKSPAVHPPQRSDLCTTLESTDNLGSSWQNVSLSGSVSPRPSSSGYTGSIAVEHGANYQNCLTTEVDDNRSDSMMQSANKNRKWNLQGDYVGVSSHTVQTSAIPATSSSSASIDLQKFEVIQAGLETVGTEEDWMIDVGVPLKPSAAEGAARSLSQLALKKSSSSLSDSFGSQSSWEKISADLTSPTNSKPQRNSLFKAGTGIQSSMLTESDESFFLMETLDTESSESAHDPTHKIQTPGSEFRAWSKPRPLESLHVDSITDKELDSVSVKPASKNSSAGRRTSISYFVPEQCGSTETSTESSFEMLDENQSGHRLGGVTSTEKVNPPEEKNPLCYSCLKQSFLAGVVPEKQYLLSQQDYRALLAGVCHECLLKRLQSNKTQFKLKKHRSAHSKFEPPLLFI